MLQFLALALALAQPDMLRCHKDSRGHLVVTEAQWKYIHQELASWKPDHVLPLIHPRRGLTFRIVVSSRPLPTGEILVSRTHKTRADIAFALKGAKVGEFTDIYHPGYTFDMVSRMAPGLTQSHGDAGTDRVLFKGAMLYWDEAEKPSGGVVDVLAKDRRYRRDSNRFSPTTYITVFCDRHRLWLAALSSDWPGE